ncbi:MAG: tetratricopeptide repeat protein [Myxococcales bacterium]|nr:tetratricopeptide repeat protein [Myxococcales bacterium]
MAGALPKLIHQYPIQGEISRSEDAACYAALDPRGGGPRALTILSPLASRRHPITDLFARDAALVRDRWLRARRTGAPAPLRLIEVFDAGTIEIDGVPRPFYVAAPAAGTLAEAIERDSGPRPIGEVVRLGRETAEALTELYGVGVAAHRYLTPSNLLVTDTGAVKLGVGVVTTRADAGDARFFAPERARGIDRLDRGADLYGLAVILYQLALGFDPGGVQHLPTRNSLERSLPPEFLALVERCTAADPAARPRDPLAFLNALEGIERTMGGGASWVAADAAGSTAPAAADPRSTWSGGWRRVVEGTGYRFGRQAPGAAPSDRFSARTPLLAALVAALGLAAWFWVADGEDPGSVLRRESRARAVVRELLAHPSKQVRRREPRDPAGGADRSEASVLNARARSLLGAGDLDGAIREGSRALALAPDRPEIHRTLALAHLRKLELDDAITNFQGLVAHEPPNSEAHTDIGWMLEQVGRLDEAKAELRRAIRLNPDRTQPQLALARVLLKLGERDEAFEVYRDAVDQARRRSPALPSTSELAGRETLNRAAEAWGVARARSADTPYHSYVDGATDGKDDLRRRVPK